MTALNTAKALGSALKDTAASGQSALLTTCWIAVACKARWISRGVQL